MCVFTFECPSTFLVNHDVRFQVVLQLVFRRHSVASVHRRTPRLSCIYMLLFHGYDPQISRARKEKSENRRACSCNLVEPLLAPKTVFLLVLYSLARSCPRGVTHSQKYGERDVLMSNNSRRTLVNDVLPPAVVCVLPYCSTLRWLVPTQHCATRYVALLHVLRAGEVSI